MTKALVGSLVVAPKELPPQAWVTPKQAASVTPSSVMRSKLGSLIQPFGGVGFIAHTIVESEGSFKVSGLTLTGKPVRATISDPREDLAPNWMRRVASIMRVAWTSDPWDQTIKTLLASQGLPVDESVNWNTTLNAMFSRFGFTNDTEREEAIQQAIVTAFVVRDSLGKFDPNHPLAGDENLPLEQRVTKYIKQLFYWQLTGDNEVGDQMHRRLRNELTVLDAPVGDGMGSTWVDHQREDAWSGGDDADTQAARSPEAWAHHDSERRSYAAFREAFGQYLLKFREPSRAEKVMTLLDLITSSETGLIRGSDVLQQWEAITGTGYAVLRDMLKTLREELLHFSRSAKAPDTSLVRLVNELRQRTMDVAHDSDEADKAGDKAKPMTDSTAAPVVASLALAATEAPVAPERRFMASLVAAIRQIVHGKTAAPKVLDQYALYFRMTGDPGDPRYMLLSFYSPAMKIAPKTHNYRIEVGDWDTDPSLPRERIRQQLGTFVVPMLRGDVLEQDHDLLEKVILQLRKLVWENAVAYFQTPRDQKVHWTNVVKMDLTRFQDTRCHIHDKGTGQDVVVASLMESGRGRLAHRMAAESGPLVGKKRQISVQASPGGYRHTHSNVKWPQAQPGDTVYFGTTLLGMGGTRGTIKSIRSDRRFLVLVSGQDQPQVVGEDSITKLVPAKQASDANGHAPESTPSEVSSAQKAGAAAFDPDLHDQEAEPSITHMALHLESTGVDPTADNMHAAVEGFTSARDTHYKKEASVSATTPKFAGMQRIAAEEPEAMATALSTMEDKLRQMLNNISVMKENFNITEPVGEIREGEPVEVKPVEGEQRLAGFKRFATEQPEAIAEALGELYTDLDGLLAMVENVADHCDVTLPDNLPTEEGFPTGDDDENPDAGLHGEMPTGGDADDAPAAPEGAPEGEKSEKKGEE